MTALGAMTSIEVLRRQTRGNARISRTISAERGGLCPGADLRQGATAYCVGAQGGASAVARRFGGRQRGHGSVVTWVYVYNAELFFRLIMPEGSRAITRNHVDAQETTPVVFPCPSVAQLPTPHTTRNSCAA